MLDEAGKQNFFKHTHELFIQPEVDRRKEEGILGDDFKIRECLIRLPKDQKPIVEFNNEFGWFVEYPELAPGIQMEAGKLMYLHEIANLGKVLPPTVDDKRVAFVYLYWTGFSYSAVFDFTPNWPDFRESENEFQLGEVIALHLWLKMIEMTVMGAKSITPQLHQIGLWPVPSLLPYPISKIIERVGTGHIEEAKAILVEHCNADFIEHRIVETWRPIKVFSDRFELFQETLFAHRNKQFHLSIYTLIPQIEGVITDWLYQIVGPDAVKWQAESKIEQFKQMVETLPQFEMMWRESLVSVCEFLLTGAPMQTFKKWLDNIDPSFPARHPTAHGRYVEEMFSEENSIKLFLLLDTICQFMMFYETRNSTVVGQE